EPPNSEVAADAEPDGATSGGQPCNPPVQALSPVDAPAIGVEPDQAAGGILGYVHGAVVVGDVRRPPHSGPKPCRHVAVGWLDAEYTRPLPRAVLKYPDGAVSSSDADQPFPAGQAKRPACVVCRFDTPQPRPAAAQFPDVSRSGDDSGRAFIGV